MKLNKNKKRKRYNIITGIEGTLGCLLHKSQKFYINVFLFVGFTTLGTFIVFLLVGSLS